MQALHFSPALYDHVVNDLKKHVILILNKIDLAPAELVIAWKEYFRAEFPELNVVFFTSHTSNLQQASGDPGSGGCIIIFKQNGIFVHYC